jgi:Ca2+-binding RTX toxin-like protein
MANYSFETITSAQAMGISANDILTVSSSTGPASSATVTYVPSIGGGTAAINLAIGNRTVSFSPTIASLSMQAGHLNFADGTLLYIGGDGADTNSLDTFGAQSGAMFGGPGSDSFQTGRGNFLLQGNAGDDQFTLGAGGSNTVYGGQGDDKILIAVGGGVPQGNNFVQGNLGNDVISGGAGFSTMLGGKGDDTINGNVGVDFLNGNLGDDSVSGNGLLFGEDGSDTLVSNGVAPTTMSGGAGNDSLAAPGFLGGSSAGTPQIVISGDDGNDVILSVNAAHDKLHGNAGNDTISTNNTALDTGDLLDGGDGNDSLSAGTGHATMLGGSGDDTISALGASNVSIDAGSGDDSLRGSLQNDTIIGGDGADTIQGLGGADILSGGAGNDHFRFDNGSGYASGTFPQIMDWSSSDHLQFSVSLTATLGFFKAVASDYTSAVTMAQQMIYAGHLEVLAVQVGSDVIVFSSDTAVDLVGRSLADISGANIL